MKSSIALAPTLALTLALSGCAPSAPGDQGADGAAAPAQQTTATRGLPIVGQWHITLACGQSTDNGDEPATIAFDDSLRVNGCATVNRFFGDYRLAPDGHLTFDHVGMTRKMGQSMAIEDAITSGINRVASVAFQGEDDATLLDSAGNALLTLVRASD